MITMANEVSFFHAIRVMTIEEELETKSKLLEMIEISKDQWDWDWKANKAYKELVESIEKSKVVLKEAKDDLEKAKAEHL